MITSTYREDVILPHVVGKRVLDCGGVDHYAARQKREKGYWLHDYLKRHASQCVAIDILETRIVELRRDGYLNFVAADAEALPFFDEFDVVVAGELVEHLYNMGLFLDSAWRALKLGGKLIVTTPNSYGFTYLSVGVLTGQERCHPQHTCYYSLQTLSYVVEEHGFRIEEAELVGREAKRRSVRWLRTIATWLRPNLSEKIVIVATKQTRQQKYANKW